MGIQLTILFCLIIALISFIFWKIRSHRNYFKNHGIACDPPNLLLGNLQGAQKTQSFSDVCLNYYFKFKGSGPMAGFFFFMNPSVFILDMDLVKNILIKDFSNFADRGFFHNEEDDPLTGQLFFMEGKKWRLLRQKLSSSFTSGKFRYMCPTVLKVSEILTSVLNDMIKQTTIVEVKDIIDRYTIDVIGTCAFGIECNSLKDRDSEFRIMARKAITDQRHGALGQVFLSTFPNLARRLHLKQTPDHIEQFYMRIVREIVEYREKNAIKRNDFMEMLIDLKNNNNMKSKDNKAFRKLSIEEIAAQAFALLSGGFETSAAALSFALYELARNPIIQEKSRAEVIQVLKDHNQEFTYDCMKEMRYLNQVISETLRLYTILPILNRQALIDYRIPGHRGYVIPKGMSVIIPCEGIHLDPEYYPNPTVFDPERFSPEMVKERDSVYWLPFGDGPRNCIGKRFGQMLISIGLAMMLRSFKFSACQQTQIPLLFDIKSFVKLPQGGIHLKVETL